MARTFRTRKILDDTGEPKLAIRRRRNNRRERPRNRTLARIRAESRERWERWERAQHLERLAG